MACKDEAQERYQKSGKGKETKAKWAAREKDRLIAYRKEWAKKNPHRQLLIHAKSRAKKKGIEFNIDLSDMTVPPVCPVFGTPFSYGERGDCPDAPSLDRIDNSKGYVKGNVCVISNRANKVKGDASLSELEAVIRYMKEHS